MEMLDWVDINDKIIKPINRTLAHTDKKFIHREVGIIIQNLQGDILLQKRSLKKKVLPGIWVVSVAGHIESGQDPMAAAHKELQEELGFDTELTYFYKELQEWKYETHFAYWYWGMHKGEQIQIDPNETDEFRFVSKDAFDSFIQNENVETNTRIMYKRFWSGEFTK